MPQLEGYGQKKPSSSFLHLITISFPSRGSKLTVGQLLFFIFYFEQAAVSSMRPICFFTSSIQSTYSIADGNVAHIQFLTRLPFPFQGESVENECVSVCAHMCVRVCMFVLQRQSKRTAAFSLGWRSIADDASKPEWG